MEDIIRVENLQKKFLDFTAVRDLNFPIHRGEIFGFLGPNGAGKTTTINMLTGMAKVTSGKIFYKNEDVTHKMKKAQKLIGIVPDESNLYPEMSAFDNLCFCGSLYGLTKKIREQRAKELLKTFQLWDVANKKFHAYSKGMKRKLTIAAALIHQPEVLFLDEPTTGIDVGSMRQIRSLIKDLNQQGVTIFLTTHYIEEAERLCDRIAFINRGNIVNIDTMNGLLENTKNFSTIEIKFFTSDFDRKSLLKKFRQSFSELQCTFEDLQTLRIISINSIDIAPVVCYLSNEKMLIAEAKLIKPSLEDVFVKMTGIEIDLMKKEKEKK
ncbi:MAG: ATP-binding cassette domain-containing protein [Candidatus Cloacimonetes bacterium]|nr:ATP-binding cassette domain-containing protein [Candidatus Cloacimonadota bacterium]